MKKRFIILAVLLLATVAQTVAITSHAVVPQQVACANSNC
jgi:hypothetical protein